VSQVLKLVGVIGSPYSRKLCAVLRFRQIPFHWVPQNTESSAGFPAGPLPLSAGTGCEVIFDG